MSNRIEPQLLQPAEAPPEGDDWLHEIKFDGYRILIAAEAERPRLWSRSGRDMRRLLPELASCLGALQARRAVLDGELVALATDGRSSFAELVRALGRPTERARLRVACWDLLSIDGERLTGEPLHVRKQKLAELLDEAGCAPLMYLTLPTPEGGGFSGLRRHSGSWSAR
jgi:bifunctional non-homologous end joining protein LigD